MKQKSWLAATIAAIVVGLSGSLEGMQDKIPEIPKPQPAAAQSMTVTGCVGRGTTAGTYVLTNVIRDGEAVGKDADKIETLVLSGSDIDISSHIGHKVSVTGMPVVRGYTIETLGATDVKPATESTMAKTGAKIPARFTVQSLTMISATCSEAGDRA
jgi:hypothetical protein